jgi:hypothetical protein
LAEAGYRIAAVNLAKDTALGRQPFEELTPEMRPQAYGDGRDVVSEDQSRPPRRVSDTAPAGQPRMPACPRADPGRPPEVFDLGDQLGPHPMHPAEDQRRSEAAGARRRHLEWHLGRSERLQASP